MGQLNLSEKGNKRKRERKRGSEDGGWRATFNLGCWVATAHRWIKPPSIPPGAVTMQTHRGSACSSWKKLSRAVNPHQRQEVIQNDKTVMGTDTKTARLHLFLFFFEVSQTNKTVSHDPGTLKAILAATGVNWRLKLGHSENCFCRKKAKKKEGLILFELTKNGRAVCSSVRERRRHSTTLIHLSGSKLCIRARPSAALLLHTEFFVLRAILHFCQRHEWLLSLQAGQSTNAAQPNTSIQLESSQSY